MNRSHVLNICFFLQGRLLLYKDKNDIKEPNNILVGNPGDDGARIDVDEKKDTNFNLILKSKTYEVGYLIVAEYKLHYLFILCSIPYCLYFSSKFQEKRIGNCGLMLLTALLTVVVKEQI